MTLHEYSARLFSSQDRKAFYARLKELEEQRIIRGLKGDFFEEEDDGRTVFRVCGSFDSRGQDCRDIIKSVLQKTGLQDKECEIAMFDVYSSVDERGGTFPYAYFNIYSGGKWFGSVKYFQDGMEEEKDKEAQ